MDHVAPESREMIRELLKKREKGQLAHPSSFEYKILRKDGQIRDLEISITSVSMEGEQFAQSTFRDITERKRAEKQLQQYQAKLRSLASELALAEERERRRIAAGLHDDMAQKLVMAKFELQSLGASVADESIAASLKGPCDLIDELVENARGLVFDLGNATLYQVGLEAAVEAWLEQEIQNKHGLRCEFVREGSSLKLDDDTRITLFRAVKELVANALKYANASMVKVCIRKSDDVVRVSVADDGAGFDVSKLDASLTSKGGFGLFSIKERLEYLGGSLKIDSGQGKGTRVTMVAPLRQEVTTGSKEATK